MIKYHKKEPLKTEHHGSRRTSLKIKVSLIIVFVFLTYGILDSLIRHFFIYNTFTTLEEEQGLKDLERVVQTLEREMFHLNSLCNDWSAWDDTYQFAQSPTSEYIDTNLSPTAFKANKTNLLYIFNKEGKKLWGEVRDTETTELLPIAEFEHDFLPLHHPLLTYEQEKPLAEQSVNGIFMTEAGPLLVASRPILTTNNEGPSQGFLIMGRLLTETVIKSLSEQTQVSFSLLPLITNPLPEDIKLTLCKLAMSSPYLVEARKDNLICHTTFPDIKRNPALPDYLTNPT